MNKVRFFTLKRLPSTDSLTFNTNTKLSILAFVQTQNNQSVQVIPRPLT